MITYAYRYTHTQNTNSAAALKLTFYHPDAYIGYQINPHILKNEAGHYKSLSLENRH